MKTCSKCEVEKPETEFYKDESSKGGLSTQCKECKSTYYKIKYKKRVADYQPKEFEIGTTKTCTKCKITKSLNCFGKCKGIKSGSFSWCKECRSKHGKDVYHNKGGKEKQALVRKDWRDNKGGKEKLAAANKDWYYNKGGKEKQLLTSKLWNNNNPDKVAAKGKRWEKNNPSKVREKRKRHQTLRRRELGFRPLNSWFEGSVAHHVNKNDVVYIPETIHKSVPHSLKTGMGMDKVNKLAFVSCVMLTGQTIKRDF